MTPPNDRSARPHPFVEGLHADIGRLVARLFMLRARPAVVIALTEKPGEKPEVLVIHPALSREQLLLLLDEAAERLGDPEAPGT